MKASRTLALSARFRPDVGSTTHRYIPVGVLASLASAPFQLIRVGEHADGRQVYSVVHSDPRVRGWFVDEDMITLEPAD